MAVLAVLHDDLPLLFNYTDVLGPWRMGLALPIIPYWMLLPSLGCLLVPGHVAGCSDVAVDLGAGGLGFFCVGEGSWAPGVLGACSQLTPG